MAGFWLHSGNRLEELVRILSSRRADGGHDPFQAEVVVLQSRGMERWLNLALADADGVCGNLELPFPRKFFQEYLFAPLLEASGKSSVEQRYFSVEAMTWRIAAELPALLSRPEFAALQRYLSAADGSSLKLVQLAAAIADRFDQYLLYRPQLILAWDSGANPLSEYPDSVWQLQLWRRLAAGREAWHFASLCARLQAQLAAGEPAAAAFSRLRQLRRVAFFGFSSLAPSLMDLVLAVSRLIDVDFYYFNPSAEFWEHNEPYRRVIRQVGKELKLQVERAGLRSVPELDAMQAALHFDTGNALLGAWGEQGREFFSLLAEREADDLDECFVEAEPEVGRPLSLLQRLQNDILCLRMPEPHTPAVARDDDSLLIQSCHGRMREVEVLYENLTGLLLRHPALQPHDILVMTPDIEQYAPLIEAVFRSGPWGDPRWMPTSIADRSSLAACPEVRIFQQLLQLHRERYRVSAVLAVLDCEAVRQRFGLTERDLELIRHWLCETGVNWGIDADDRELRGDVRFTENSWRHGLDRMLAGFAMSTDGRDEAAQLWTPPVGEALLPYDQIENDGETILGRLGNFTAKIFALGRNLTALENEPLVPARWRDLLLQAVDDFLPDTAACYDAVNALRSAINGVMEDLIDAGFDLDAAYPELPLTLDGWWARLAARLGERTGGGFLRGGITFCEAQPLRSVPARVVCLLGLEEDTFPRQDRSFSFDLMRCRPYFGDRSSRHDDRYFFLESLLSARQCLYLSYVGQSDKDNTLRPPSVLLSELLDYLVRYYAWADGAPLTENDLIVRHPLQAFSSRYFTGTASRLQSWSTEHYRLAVWLAAIRSGVCPPERVDLTALPPSPAADEAETAVFTLSELTEFFTNPAKYFCRRRLGVDLEVRDAELPADQEKFELNQLDMYQLAEELMDRYLDRFRGPLDAALMQTCYEHFQRRGQLPPSVAGRAAFEQFFGNFYQYAARVAQLVGERLPPLKLTVSLPDTALPLHLEFSRLYRVSDRADGIVQLFSRYSSRSGKEKEMVKARLAHLALNLPEVREQLGQSQAVPTCYKFKKKNQDWSGGSAFMTPPAACLAELIKLFQTGQTRPLELVPEASLKLWTTLHKKPDMAPRELWSDVAVAWAGWWGSDQGVDPYVAFCFGEEFPDEADFRDRFQQCASNFIT